LGVGRNSLLRLNVQQRQAHDIISSHLDAHLAGKKPRQLLMMVHGAGGTGKTTLVEEITRTFEEKEDGYDRHGSDSYKR
jgi:Cdc6-like AAA superfamily ATPase